MEGFALLSISGAPAPGGDGSSSPDPPRPAGRPGEPRGGAEGRARPPGLRRLLGPSFPAGTAEAAGAVPGEPPGAEPPAHRCTVYRPWFSPYSYFVCAAARPAAAGRPASPAREPEEPDDLSEIVCSSSCSPDEPRPAEPARRGPAAWDGVTVQDLLAASQWQLAPQDGYKCVACCRVFPTLCSLKTHIRHGAREGFSCRVYYRKLKALWEKERRAQEALDAAAPL
ncbi:spermatogenesis-associated protein 46 [Rhea pennata]|uniref:spermatogenesis-associated protein 46 n=1 Tax=Rhea pennata TaxID=8795 RepID=UPI002E25E449